jgi:predicted RNA-binding Zn-ribbon protein involved in translation (DUF1610 family)
MGGQPPRGPEPPAVKAPCQACGALLTIPREAAAARCGTCGKAFTIKRS